MTDSNGLPQTTEDIDNIFKSQQPQISVAPWRDRKRVIIFTLTFCALCIAYILYTGRDLAIYQTVAMSAFGLAASTVGFFIAGQTFHDINNSKIDTVRRINRLPPLDSVDTVNVTMPIAAEKDTDER